MIDAQATGEALLASAESTGEGNRITASTAKSTDGERVTYGPVRSRVIAAAADNRKCTDPASPTELVEYDDLGRQLSRAPAAIVYPVVYLGQEMTKDQWAKQP